MTSQTITIPTQPIANQPFTIHYNNPTYVPTYSTTTNTNFVLKNTNGNTVSSVFGNPTYGISILGSHNPPPASCSTLIHDSQHNYYYTNNISFFFNAGTYYVYRFNQTLGQEDIFINDVTLTNECPIGLAIDNFGFFYVALQTTSKIRRYNPSTYSFGNPITSGTTIISSGINGPCGLKFDSNNHLYVTNRVGNNVLKYDISNLGLPILLQTITSAQFDQPLAININSIGELFVSNLYNNPSFTNCYLFKINTTTYTATIVNNILQRQSCNMVFDIDNNIYLPDFNLVGIYRVNYGLTLPWTSTFEGLYGTVGPTMRMGGIDMTLYNNLAIIRTNPGITIDLKYLTYTFVNTTLPQGNNLLTLFNTSTNTAVTTFTIFVEGQPIPPGPTPDPVICFKEGTKILCRLNGADVYVPIEYIEEGTLVKTYKHGYKKCKFNMKEQIKNTEEHSINNLYRLSRTNNTQLFEDLYITGSHAMLYDTISEREEEAMNNLLETYNSKFDIQINNKIDDKYKLIAYYDNTFVEVKQNIVVSIYHLVLENENKYVNYGIYANGVLTESIDEVNLLRYYFNDVNEKINLINVAKTNKNTLKNVIVSKGSMMNVNRNAPKIGSKELDELTNKGSIRSMNANLPKLGTKLMNKLTNFK
jgi:hypothetical protein